MENRLKLKICELLQTCRSKNISDVSSEPFFFQVSHHHRQLIDLFSPKSHSLSDNKPKAHKLKPNVSHPDITHKSLTFLAGTHCRRPRTTTKNKPRRNPKKIECISSTTDSYYYDWRSSDDDNYDDDEDDETTLLSSRSFPSESSGSFRKNRACRKSEKKPKRTSDGGCGFDNKEDSDETPLKNSGKLVKDSFAVAKKSSNPHEDFRVSMVEMIVEKQMFRAEDLTNLYECFILLNSDEHHRVIFEVFTEVLEALYSASD